MATFGDRFRSASILVKEAFGLSIAAVLFDIIGFPTPYWRVGIGLFTCRYFYCEMHYATSKALIAMVILGFLLGVACLVLTTCYIFVEPLGTKIIKNVCMALAFAAAFFTFVGLIIFTSLWGMSFSWSYILVLIAGMLYLATGAIHVHEMITQVNETPT